MQEGEFVKEKQELEKLKQELDEFYNNKEEIYQQNIANVENTNNNIQKRLDEIKLVKEENQKILDEIKKTVTSKAMLLYGKMKPKLVYQILQKKIDDGDLNEVFDIIIRLKSKRVMKLMKMFDTPTSTQLMDMISKYKNNEQKENTDG